MADDHLRFLERQWRNSGDPTDGAQLVLYRMRAGQLVHLEEYPSPVWEAIDSLHLLSEISHHITIGRTADGGLSDQQLDIPLKACKAFIPNLQDTIYRRAHRLTDWVPLQLILQIDFPGLDGTFAEMVLHAVCNQQVKTSIVYYPTVPSEYSLVMYLGIKITPEILGPFDIEEVPVSPSRDFLSDLEEALGEGHHFALVIRIFFDPSAKSLYPTGHATPKSTNVAAIFPCLEHEMEGFLQAIPEIYDWVDYPGLSHAEQLEAAKTRVPFIVIKPYGI